MSTPTALGEVEPKKKGFGRYIRRVKDVLQKGSSARGPKTGATGVDPAEDTSVFTTRSEVATVPPPVQDAPRVPPAEPLGNPHPMLDEFEKRAIDRCEMVKAMFAKHKIDFDESSWPIKPRPQNVRVEKVIRMRVRIVCHSCRTNYTSSNQCPNCHHRRCEHCTRLPPPKEKGKLPERVSKEDLKEKVDEVINPSAPDVTISGAPAADLAAASGEKTEDVADEPRLPVATVPRRRKRKRENLLTLPSRTGGQDLVRKVPRQRVHRTCCRCHQSFVRGSDICPRCQHSRCIRCPRLPPKLEKWPTAYPGDIIPPEPAGLDRQWKKPRLRVRWTCHHCQKLFIERERRCANCFHTRCSDCHREPPERTPQQFTAEAVQSAREKLDALGGPSGQSDPSEDAPAATSHLEYSATARSL